MDTFDLFGTKAETVVEIPALPTLVLPEDPRERFRVLHGYLGELKSYALVEVLQKQFDTELEDAVAALNLPKKRGKKKEPHEILGDQYAVIRAKYTTAIEQTMAARREEADQVKETLANLADTIPVVPGDTWVKRATVSTVDYGSQGLGANTYARASAQQKAEHYVLAGLAAEVRVRHSENTRSDLTYFEVWVQASEEDCEIAYYKSGQSFKDWLQGCWDKAINPRVLLPGLPWGIEEKLGVTIGRVLPREV